CSLYLFPFYAPARPSISALSLHDALPISADMVVTVARQNKLAKSTRRIKSSIRHWHRRFQSSRWLQINQNLATQTKPRAPSHETDRKSTRLNSSHVSISYAVFCLKKKNKP